MAGGCNSNSGTEDQGLSHGKDSGHREEAGIQE